MLQRAISSFSFLEKMYNNNFCDFRSSNISKLLYIKIHKSLLIFRKDGFHQVSVKTSYKIFLFHINAVLLNYFYSSVNPEK